MSFGDWRDAFVIHLGDVLDRPVRSDPFFASQRGTWSRARQKPTPKSIKRAKARKAQKAARKRTRK